MPLSSAVFTMPRAIGCSDSDSMPDAMRSASSSASPSATDMATTRNSPSVNVPVLSKITVSRFRASSSPRRSRTRRPLRAPSVVEMATTNGTASPSACGQAITSTVTIRTTEKSSRCPQQLPHHEGDGRSADRHDGQKPGRAVGQVLRSGLGLLRIGHEPHDAGELGLLPRPGDLDAQRSLSVDRGGDHLVAFPLLHRPGLAGDHRLVDVTLPLAHHSVRGNALARTHQQEVAVLQRADGDLLLAPIGDPRRGIREELRQFLQRPLGLIDGPHLDPVTEEHDRDQRGQLPPQRIRLGSARAERPRRTGRRP